LSNQPTRIHGASQAPAFHLVPHPSGRYEVAHVGDSGCQPSSASPRLLRVDRVGASSVAGLGAVDGFGPETARPYRIQPRYMYQNENGGTKLWMALPILFPTLKQKQWGNNTTVTSAGNPHPLGTRIAIQDPASSIHLTQPLRFCTRPSAYFPVRQPAESPHLTRYPQSHYCIKNDTSKQKHDS